eukprot:gene14995-16541_t
MDGYNSWGKDGSKSRVICFYCGEECRKDNLKRHTITKHHGKPPKSKIKNEGPNYRNGSRRKLGPGCRYSPCSAGYECVESCTQLSGYICVEQWLVGDGIGGTEANIGVYSSKEACILECSKRSNGVVYANAASYSDSGQACYCEFGMTGRSGTGYLSAYISPSCTSYSSLTEANRNVNAPSSGTTYCDSGLSLGSYRISGSAGVKIPTSCVAGASCTTHGAGWIATPEPTQADGVVIRKVCFSYSNNCCFHNKMVRVRNCGSYFVYELVSTGSCSHRYCGTN